MNKSVYDKEAISFQNDDEMLSEILSDETEENKIISILVIEDDAHDFDLIRRKLNTMRAFEVELFHATDVVTARNLVENNTIDIALVDYFLGSDSGVRAIQEVGGRVGNFPIVMVSGTPGNHVQKIGMSAGAINHLNKDDISSMTLETTIRSALYTHKLEVKLKNSILELKKIDNAKTIFFEQVSYLLNHQISELLTEVDLDKKSLSNHSKEELICKIDEIKNLTNELSKTFDELLRFK